MSTRARGKQWEPSPGEAKKGVSADLTCSMSHHTTIPLCAQCLFFSGRFFENFRAIGLDTEHESFFLGRQPRACGRASKRETKQKKAPP